MSYQLANCVSRNAMHPDTFQIDDTSKVKVGDFCKLVFESDGRPGERMWVKVTKIRGDSFTGTLSNDPVFYTELQDGSLILFHRSSIANVLEG